MQEPDATKTARDAELTVLERIASALERLSPPVPAVTDIAAAPAYTWDNGQLRAVHSLGAQPLDAFVGIDHQRNALLENTLRLANGLAAHDVLLWGARGMGKSGLVKAVVGDLQARGLPIAVIEVERDDIPAISELLRVLAATDRRFVLFCDDLSFDADEWHYRRLRSVLEGGIEARPGNCRFYVTSNRRHLVPREIVENEAAQAVNARDVLDDRLALADRFGLSLGFHACDQATYVAMVSAYAERLGLPLDAHDAIAWATARGGRSGRVAWQYVQELAGRSGRSL